MTYAEINRNNLLIAFSEGKCVEEFRKKFTTLGDDIVSRAIFSHDVLIKYHDGNRVELISDKDFTYKGVSMVVNHMLCHGFHFTEEVLSSMLEQACALDLENLVVLKSGEKPTYVVEVAQGRISLSPISGRYLNLEGETTKKLVDLLQREVTLSGVDIDIKNRAVHVVAGGNASDVQEAIASVMVSIGAIERGDKEVCVEMLRSLLFRDLARNELKIVKNIANFSQAHPLSKYKCVAKSIESILSSLDSGVVDSDTVRLLEEALEGRGEFSTAPAVLMKGFSKLNKSFSTQLQGIISSSHQEN